MCRIKMMVEMDLDEVMTEYDHELESSRHKVITAKLVKLIRDDVHAWMTKERGASKADADRVVKQLDLSDLDFTL